MATLVSPGVSVTIVDESFYGGAGPGTVPLVVLATAANKASPTAGGGIAPYTAPSQAGVLFLATSQRELIQNFGNPSFKVVQGTPIPGYELNEYGLMAAYQFLGLSNRCYVLRADIDLAALEPAVTAPVSPPLPGTYWMNLSQTRFGIFQSNGNLNSSLAWTTQSTLFATAANVDNVSGTDVPKASFGSDGQFAVVVTQSNNLIYEKIGGTWYGVGTTDWKAAHPTFITGSANPGNILTTDTIVINGSTVAFDQIPNGGGGFNAGTGSIADTVTAINDANITDIVASVSGSGALVLENVAGGSITLANGNGTPLATYGISPGTTAGVSYQITNNPQYPSGTVAGSVWIKGNPTNNGASWNVQYYNGTTGAWITLSAPFYAFNSSLSDGNASKDTAATSAFGSSLKAGSIYVGYDNANGAQQLRRYDGSQWSNLIYEAGTVAPTTEPAAGTPWFNANFQADIMYGDGNAWLGYNRKFADTDPAGVIIDGSAPTMQSDGTALVDNDLWLDSSDAENYPLIYRYNATQQKWALIDNTDNTSPFGIIFADARQDSGTNYTNNTGAGTYQYNSTAAIDLVKSSFVDPDAPNPSAYPDGMLLFNSRFATNNVKEWNPTYFNSGGFDPNTDFTQTTYTNGNNTAVFPALPSAGRWVTASGNDIDGKPFMGRKAQRVMIVRALQAVVEANQDIRSELVFYNLISAPGYPELLDEMVTLNTDQNDVAFIVGDTPARLAPTGTAIQNWATNAKNVAQTGEDGLLTANPYVGIYYPWGLSTDLSGNEIMMPPSSIALTTIAYNDQVAYPWFAPAGFTRGLVTNASSVGYLTSAGEFQPVILNQGQRDVLYTNAINPIAYIPGRGLVVYGQKTLNPGSGADASGGSALDRINVARLANYIAYNLDNLVKPFLFEQNDAQTQAAVLSVVTGFLNGLVSLQGLSDYAAVCDSSNNTATRVDANELWIDVAIKPLKAIEFIYIPVRILNTGANLSTALSSTIQL